MKPDFWHSAFLLPNISPAPAIRLKRMLIGYLFWRKSSAYDPSSLGRQIASITVSGHLSPLLSNMKAPSLVIQGEDDHIFVPACGVDTASAIPSAELTLIDGMGHDLPHQLFNVIADGIERTAHRH